MTDFTKQYRKVPLLDGPASLGWSMGSGVPGSMDGLILQSDWRKQPNNIPLKNGRFFVPQGTPLPLKYEEMWQQLPQNSMFMFARNVSSPDCCPSTFSSDMGCICTTPYQRRYVSRRRGNNKTWGKI